MFVSYYSFFQTNNKSECLEKGYNWTNAQITFDNVIAGYLSLFQIVSYYHQYSSAASSPPQPPTLL